MGKLDLRPHIDRFARRFAEVEASLNDPKTFENPQRAQELAKEYARLKELTAHGTAYLKTVADLEDSRALVGAESDAELLTMAKEDVTRLEAELQRLELELQRGIIPPEPSDSRNTIIEIRAGAGGSESALFAADLYRMYTRYAETQGWKIEPLDLSYSDLGGLREVTFLVSGTG
jgi:peptide chain release factor 1